MRFSIFASVLALLSYSPAVAGSYGVAAVQGGSCGVSAVQGGYCGANLQVQAQAYAAPVQQLQVQAYAAPVQQVRVVQRVVQPQAVYVAPQAVVAQKVYSAPVVQQQVVTPYVQQQLSVSTGYGVRQNLAVQGYGASNVAAVRVGRPLAVRQPIFGGSQRVVTKSRTVTKSGSAGLIGRLLGR